MSLPTSIQARIDEVKNVIDAGRPFLGGLYLDEQAFFVATTRLRKALPDAMKAAEGKTHGAISVLSCIDDLERMIETGNLHTFGKVLVRDRQECLKQIDNMEAALDAGLKLSEHWQPVQETGEGVVAEARLEAARIVDEAQREAERILKEARERASLGIGS